MKMLISAKSYSSAQFSSLRNDISKRAAIPVFESSDLRNGDVS